VTRDDRLRVVVADDEALFRGGLTMIIEAEPDLTVVAEASDGQQALDAVRAQRPDVVLMDIQMPGLNGIAATAAILRLNLPTRILVLTTFGRDGFVYDALRSGASGYLLKTVPPAQLVQAVRSVAAGDALLAPTLTRRLIEDWSGGPDPTLATLGSPASPTGNVRCSPSSGTACPTPRSPPSSTSASPRSRPTSPDS
jgi:DNA-binding NarL/FixJ family response regulator